MKHYYYPDGIKTELVFIGQNEKFTLYASRDKNIMYVYDIDGNYINNCFYRDIQDLSFYGFPSCFSAYFQQGVRKNEIQ